MPFTPKTILLAGAVGALAMLGAVEAQAGHFYAPIGAYPLDPVDPPLLTPLTDEALEAAEDAHDAAEDAAAAAAAAAAAVSAAALAHDMLDD